jgi:SAM-dependent methyltransferase
MTETVATIYDEVAYPSLACAETHPRHLATVATLLGLAPPPVANCRVLELGCGNGANLIPMAAGLPGASFVGVDLAARPIAKGQAAIAELGLANVALHQMDIMDFPPDWGAFDYIIADGVYSWTPPVVREQVLTICGRHLAPEGVAYISYNALPTWHVFGIIRDILLYQTRALDAPAERARVALAHLERLAGPPPDPHSAVGNMIATFTRYLTQRLEQLGDGRAGYLLHDALAEFNEPLYLHQFVERAARHGLYYLAEADLPTGWLGLQPPGVAEAVDALGGDAIEHEQNLDFIRGRAFHRSLLSRHRLAEPALRPEHLRGLLATSAAKRVEAPFGSGLAAQFQVEDGPAMTLEQPLCQVALAHLVECWPLAVPFETLLDIARERVERAGPAAGGRADLAHDADLLATNLLQAYRASPKLVGLHTHAPRVAATPGERPIAARVARLEAKAGGEVTNLYHSTFALTAPTRALLLLLDGSRDRPALLRDLTRIAVDGRLNITIGDQPVTDIAEIEAVLADGLESALTWLARAALLEA